MVTASRSVWNFLNRATLSISRKGDYFTNSIMTSIFCFHKRSNCGIAKISTKLLRNGLQTVRNPLWKKTSIKIQTAENTGSNSGSKSNAGSTKGELNGETIAKTYKELNMIGYGGGCFQDFATSAVTERDCSRNENARSRFAVFLDACGFRIHSEIAMQIAMLSMRRIDCLMMATRRGAIRPRQNYKNK
jgi:hypothetical protein